MREVSSGLDAYSPPEIAQRVEAFGVAKSAAPWWQTFMLGMLAGGFIGLGGLYYTFMTVGDGGWQRLAGGLVLSTGYMLAILAGAEVFTSNNLLAMAWASRKVSSWRVLRNWSIVLCANAVGAVGLAVIFLISGLPLAEDGAVGERAVALAAHSSSLGAMHAFGLGVLGNLFVCLAVWVSMAGRSVTDKVVGTILPLSALGALGLEHVVASLYLIPRGLLLQWLNPELVPEGVEVTVAGGLFSVFFVTLGNIFGGSLMVALAYYVTYLRPPPRSRGTASPEPSGLAAASGGRDSAGTDPAVTDPASPTNSDPTDSSATDHGATDNGATDNGATDNGATDNGGEPPGLGRDDSPP